MMGAFGNWLVKIWELFGVKNINSFNCKFQKQQNSVKLTSRRFRPKHHGTDGNLRGSHQATKYSCRVQPQKRRGAF